MVEDDAVFSDLKKEANDQGFDYTLEVDEADTSDEEYKTARDRVKGCNTKLNELAQQLQKEVTKGKLGPHNKPSTSRFEQV